jgi:ATP-dependent Lhr-like helicase
MGLDVETMWSDDGFVVRMPEWMSARRAAVRAVADEVEISLSASWRERAFAAHFREVAGCAAAAAARRTAHRVVAAASARLTCWLSRRATALPRCARDGRECLRDVFDMPALVDTLTRISRCAMRVVIVDTPHRRRLRVAALQLRRELPDDGDAPLAERRAQALSVDYAQLRD